MKANLLSILQKLKGEENAVTSEVLANSLCTNQREVLQMVSELRENSFPICASNQGLYYPASDDEIKRCVQRLKSRAINTLRSMKALSDRAIHETLIEAEQLRLI
jgi:hypothetical protein